MAEQVHYRLRQIQKSWPVQYEWVVTLKGEVRGKHVCRADVVEWLAILRGQVDDVQFGGIKMTGDRATRLRVAEYLETVIEG